MSFDHREVVIPSRQEEVNQQHIQAEEKPQ